ncbi:hypothetical protein ACQJBY_006214 [Aegilops geniculata]
MAFLGLQHAPTKNCIFLSTSAQQKAPEKFRVCFHKSSMVFLRLQHPCIQVEL